MLCFIFKLVKIDTYKQTCYKFQKYKYIFQVSMPYQSCNFLPSKKMKWILVSLMQQNYYFLCWKVERANGNFVLKIKVTVFPWSCDILQSFWKCVSASKFLQFKHFWVNGNVLDENRKSIIVLNALRLFQIVSKLNKLLCWFVFFNKNLIWRTGRKCRC